MLDGERAEQQQIDDDRRDEIAVDAGVDRLRDDEIADEADGIQEREEEDHVRGQAERDARDFVHTSLPKG